MSKENVELRKSCIYIISDGTGETAATMVKAALVHYQVVDVHIVRCKNIRTEPQLETVLSEALESRALVVHTFANPKTRELVAEKSLSKGLAVFDLLGPLLNHLNQHFGVTATTQSNVLRTVDERYFKRIEAIEYTVKHDDGKTTSDLTGADIVLVGVSRTSKTPLSIFLSHKGWKVANIPLVLGVPLPKELFEVDQRKIVGLIIDADSLSRIRRNRLEKFGQDPGGEYAQMKHIEREIEYAQELFSKNKRWPVFNVTDRALEETAAEIIRIVAARMGLPDKMLF